MSTSGSQRLYELLPFIYRAFDETRGNSLRALLGVIGEEYDRLHADIGQLYDDWFIETCEEQLVPYIGELVGVPLEEHPGAPGYLLRARVANAIRHRRRKGLPSTLAQAIWETCGWSAAVLESFRYLAATQHVDHVHLERGRAVDVRRGGATLLAQGAPRTGHLADVRGGEETTFGRRGLFNTYHVGLMLSRMQVYPVERSEPWRVADGCYTFHALGLDSPLFTLLRREERPELPPSLEMPLPLSPQRLEADVAEAREHLTHSAPSAESRYVGQERGLAVLWDDVPVPPADFEVRSLEHWHRPGPSLVGLLSSRPRHEHEHGHHAHEAHEHKHEEREQGHHVHEEHEHHAHEEHAHEHHEHGEHEHGHEHHGHGEHEHHGHEHDGHGHHEHEHRRHMELEAWMGEEGPHTLRLHPHSDELPALAAALEEALRAASSRPAFAHARVLVLEHELLVLPGLPLAGHHPVRFGPTPHDAETVHELGLSREHARRVAVLVSHELPPATGEHGTGHLSLRLGTDAPVVLSVPLGGSPEEMARALRHQLEAHPGWHALSHEDLLLLVADAPHASQYLRAGTDVDSRTARRLGLSPRVAVDVRRGRLAFSLGEEPAGRKLRVSWSHGRAEDLGAGPYPREAPEPWPDTDDTPTWRAEVCADAPEAWRTGHESTRFRDLAQALAAWKDWLDAVPAQETDSDAPLSPRGVLRLLDSSTYAPPSDETAFHVHVTPGATLRVEAADGELPTLDGVLVAYGTGREARLELDGLQMRGLEARGSLALTVSHATVLGALHAPRDNPASQDVDFLSVELRASLLGPVYLPAGSSRLEVSDCVLRAEDESEGHALAGAGGGSLGPTSWLTRTTVLGSVSVEALPLAEDSLFTRHVEVRHIQESLLRTCALPWPSRHLPRHPCLLFSRPLEAAEGATIASSPEFVSLSPGEPGYARLADAGPPELRTGAGDGGEFGVYHLLREERRLVALRDVLEEFLPAGLSAGVFFID